MNLVDVDASAWAELDAAAANPHSGFRYVSLCSVDASNKPQARMVVVRRAGATIRLLEFHTDTRSLKWRELSANPLATILGFCAQTRLQLRLQGVLELHGPGSEVVESVWERLSPRMQRTYAGGPPGGDRHFEATDEWVTAKAVSNAGGKDYFGVLTFRAETLDWFQLQQTDNLRARFIYNEQGALADYRWINP